jgi:RimJ/RimL family protein N-acetyltransferase
LVDRRPIFEWLTNSEITNRMMGPPTYHDSPIPIWEEFINDYKEYFFDNSKTLSGLCFIIEVNSESIGQINHDKISNIDKSTVLDIWLKNSKYINKGYGSDAIKIICNYLNQNFGCKKFIIAPSSLNFATIRAYEKAGFIRTEEKQDRSSSDYNDTVILIKFIE